MLDAIHGPDGFDTTVRDVPFNWDATVTPRQLRFEPGYRERFWHRNCVAVGLSSGFIEPLEASALAMVELSAAMIVDEMPVTRGA